MKFQDSAQPLFEDFGEEDPRAASTPAPLTAAQIKAQADAAARDALTKQILGSSDPTQWSGEGFGLAEANARNMAEILSGIGITDISQFGKIQAPVYDTYQLQKLQYDDGSSGGWGYYVDTGDSPTWNAATPEMLAAMDANGVAKVKTGVQDTYGNKLTGQAVGNTYGERQTGNAWGGTYAGSGNTGYRVRFDAQGNPHFYTTGASSSDIANVAPILSILSVIPSPLQPFAAMANAAVAASQGNVLGALASVAGIPGVTETLSSIPALSEVMNVAKTANQVSNTVKAIESGNVLGALTSVSGLTGVGGTVIGDTGFTVGDVLKTANIAKAVESGDPAAMTRAISMLVSQPSKTEAPLTPEEELERSLNRLQKSLGKTGYTPPESDTYIEQPVTPEAPTEGALPSVSPQVPTEEPIAQPFVGALPSSDTVEVKAPLEAPTETPVELPVPTVGALPSSDTVEVTAPPKAPIQLPTEELVAPTIRIPQEIQQPEVVVTSDKPVQPEVPIEYFPLSTVLPEDKTPEVVITSDRPKQEEQPTDTSPLSTVLPEDTTPEVVITSDRPVQPETPIEVGTITPSEIPVTTPTVTPTTTPKVSTPTKTSTPTTPSTTSASSSSGTPDFSPKFLEVKNPWLTIKGPTTKGGVQQERLQQLYERLDPELQAQMSPKMQNTEEAAHGGSIYSSIDPDLLQLLSARMGYAEGGDVDPFATMQKTMDAVSPKFVKQSPVFLVPKGQNKGAQLQALTQLKSMPRMGGLAQGGLPSKYSEAAPKGHNPEFITGVTGYYAGGRGTGQSDDIPAMLHDGDYVIDAEAVSAFGDGSSKAGKGVLSHFMGQVPHRDGAEGKPVPAKIADGEFVLPASFVTALGGGDNRRGAALLDEMRERLRAHKRSAPTSKIPPKAKSPLDYLKGAKG